jgi:hypothetical protein
MEAVDVVPLFMLDQLGVEDPAPPTYVLLMAVGICGLIRLQYYRVMKVKGGWMIVPRYDNAEGHRVMAEPMVTNIASYLTMSSPSTIVASRK